MKNSTNMRILELLRFLYERTDENHPATVSDIIAHLNGKGCLLYTSDAADE